MVQILTYIAKHSWTQFMSPYDIKLVGNEPYNRSQITASVQISNIKYLYIYIFIFRIIF